MKKTLRRTGAFLVSLFLMVSLAACGASSEPEGSITESSVVEESSVEESSTAESGAENNSQETAAAAASATTGETASEQESKEAGTDILVVYFSRTGEQYGVGEIDKGNTAIVADMIIDKTGADSFEIRPEEDYYPYTYDELTDVANQ